DPSPFRTARMDRAANRDPVLDYCDGASPSRIVHAQAAMIAVTVFRGKRVAVFGLGGSGMASARALMAGGAEVVAFDDSAESVKRAAAEGIRIEDLRSIAWSKIAALVLAPGVPLTHPAPHWSVGLARSAAVEVIGDVELYCRERRRLVPNSPFVAITG